MGEQQPVPEPVRIIKSAYKTEAGHRPELNVQRNEDRVLVPQQMGDWMVAGIFDGMGGHAAGDIASGIALDTAKEQLTTALPGATSETVDAVIRIALEKASSAIKNRATGIYKGMGSTGVVAALSLENELVVANAGDSRVVVYDQTKPAGQRVRVVTIDQIYLVDGKSDEEAHQKISELANSPDPYNTIITAPFYLQLTSSLGPGGTTVDTYREQLQPGNRVFVMSDGISDILTLQEMERIIESSSDLNTICTAMCERVNAVYRNPSDKLQGRKKSYLDDKSVGAFEVPGLEGGDGFQEAAVPESPGGPESPGANTPEVDAPVEVLSEEEKWKMARIEGSQGLDKLYTVINKLGPVTTPQGMTMEPTTIIAAIEQAMQEYKNHGGRTAPVSAIPDIYDLRSLAAGHIKSQVHFEMHGSKVPLSQVADAGSIAELYVYLRKIGSVQGRQQEFSSDLLITQIEKYLSGESPETAVTSTEELRFLVRGFKKVLEHKMAGRAITLEEALASTSIMEYVAMVRNAKVDITQGVHRYDGEYLGFLAERAFSRAKKGDDRYLNDGPTEAAPRVRELIEARVAQLKKQSTPRDPTVVELPVQTETAAARGTSAPVEAQATEGRQGIGKQLIEWVKKLTR